MSNDMTLDEQIQNYAITREVADDALEALADLRELQKRVKTLEADLAHADELLIEVQQEVLKELENSERLEGIISRQFGFIRDLRNSIRRLIGGHYWGPSIKDHVPGCQCPYHEAMSLIGNDLKREPE